MFGMFLRHSVFPKWCRLLISTTEFLHIWLVVTLKFAFSQACRKISSKLRLLVEGSNRPPRRLGRLPKELRHKRVKSMAFENYSGLAITLGASTPLTNESSMLWRKSGKNKKKLLTRENSDEGPCSAHPDTLAAVPRRSRCPVCRGR